MKVIKGPRGERYRLAVFRIEEHDTQGRPTDETWNPVRGCTRVPWSGPRYGDPELPRARVRRP